MLSMLVVAHARARHPGGLRRLERSVARRRAQTEGVPPTLPAATARGMIELAVALGWTLAEVRALDDAELATLVDVLEARHG